MRIDPDFKRILLLFNSVKKDLNENVLNKDILTSKEVNDLLGIREIQLKTVIEISEKLLKQLEAVDQVKPVNIEDSSADYKLLNQKFQILKNTQRLTEENLKDCKSEIQRLKNEIEQISSVQGKGNLFSLELYQSENEDMKKHYNIKVAELEDELQQLKSSNIQKNFSELLSKFNILKKELNTSKEKIKELEEILLKNSEQKKFTEKKYSELVDSHKKMFSYIENLELRVREFQNKRKKKKNTTLDSISREYSSSFSKNYSEEQKSLKLAITVPLMIFSIKKIT